MPGPPPKPKDQRQRRNKDEGTTSESITLAPAGSAGLAQDPPALPRSSRMLKHTRDLWDTLWSSPVATQVEASDLPALYRWIHLVDEEERLRRAVAETKLVARGVLVGMDGPVKEGELVMESEVRAQRIPGHLGVGSQGQLVRSPDFDALMKVRAELRALEDRFGFSPMARFRLGWQKAEGAKSLLELNQSIAAAVADAISDDHHQ